MRNINPKIIAALTTIAVAAPVTSAEAASHRYLGQGHYITRRHYITQGHYITRRHDRRSAAEYRRYNRSWA